MKPPLVPLSDLPVIFSITLVAAMMGFGLPVVFRSIMRLADGAGKGSHLLFGGILWLNRFFLWPLGFAVLPFGFFMVWGVPAVLFYAIIVGQACYWGRRARLESLHLPLQRSSVRGGIPLHFLFRPATWERRYLLCFEMALIIPLSLLIIRWTR